MNMEPDSFPTSSSMVSVFSSPTFRFLCATGLVVRRMARRWLTTLVAIPDMSEGAQANKLTFLMSWSCISRSSSYLDIFQVLGGRDSFYFYAQSRVLTLEISIWDFKKGGINQEKRFPIFPKAILTAFSGDLLISSECTELPFWIWILLGQVRGVNNFLQHVKRGSFKDDILWWQGVHNKVIDVSCPRIYALSTCGL